MTRHPRLRPVAGVTACILALCTMPVLAQSFLGTGPLRSFVLPTEPRDAAPPAELLATVPAAEPATPGPVLRGLPATLKGLRFAGERGDHDWPLYLTAAQAKAGTQFRLAFQSAISVMPEGSRLVLAINDVVLGTIPLKASASGHGFAVPAGLLKPGFNAVRIVVEQRHRVDCSPAATYELWTTLDPAASGLVLSPEAARQGYDGIRDLAGLRPRGDGAMPIRLRAGGKLSPALMERAVQAAQLAALSGGHLRPLVEFGAEPGDGTGLDLAVGTAEALRTQAGLSDIDAVLGRGYGFLPPRADRGPVFAVTGATLADLDRALSAWDQERLSDTARGDRAGSAAGLRAADLLPGFAASGTAQTIAFKDLGVAGTEFSGRVLRLGVDVTMPMDFLPADYDRMTLNLAGSHGAALDREASILVEVNGKTAATQMLGASTAASLERNQIFLPLRLMRPGQNRIEIIAQVPSREDGACVPGAARDARRLQILDRSELVLPRVARIGRLPDLAMLAAGGYPYARAVTRPILFVPNPDRQTMAASATLAARMAVAAGRPLGFDFTVTAPAEARDVLMVSPAPTLDPALMRAAGLDPERVRQAWAGKGADGGEGIPVPAAALDTTWGCGLPRADPTARIAALGVTSDAAPTGFSFAALGLKASLPATPLWERAEPVGALVTPQAALIVAQDFPDEAAPHLWTVVTARDSSALQQSVACLGTPALWSSLGGRLSVLRGDETVVTAASDEGLRYIATQPFGLGNQRLVAAGWLSLNPLAYVAIMLAVVLCLAAATLGLVLNTGRRQE